jgi:hypothetical protein
VRCCPDRYSRAIDIRLSFSDGTHQDFTLEDREEVPQNLTLVPVTTTFVKITIMSHARSKHPHNPDAYSKGIGFEEVEIYETDCFGNACDNCDYILNPDQNDIDDDGK